MTSMKKMLSVLLALAMMGSLLAMVTGCKGDDGESQDTTEVSTTVPVDTDSSEDTEETTTTVPGDAADDNTEKATYQVTVKTVGGMVLEGVTVYVYADSSLTDLKGYGETDAEGRASIELPVGSDYAIDLEDVATGYELEDFYTFSGNACEIVLSSSLVKDESLSGASLGLGDVMYDFSVTTATGDTVTLSEVLAEKKMVLLNFFYTSCGPCVTEFPYMQEAYEKHQDSVGIIALDPIDDAAAVEGFQSSMGLTFPMAACQSAWSQTFNVSGYPTSIVIDRYGVICLIEVGGLTSARPFNSIFSTFSADDYQQKIYNSLDEVVTKVKPDSTMASSEEVGALINSGEITVAYRAEVDDEYSWPFIAGEKNGEACLYASNRQVEASYAIMYADVTLKAGEAVGFDYLISSEQGADILHVIVDDEPIYTISGVSDPDEWKSAYPWVASQDGTYEVAFCYIKDDTTDEGDDTVYLKNMRVVSANDIDVETYIPQYASISEDGFEYTYVDIFLNEDDGYYHVGAVDGPLLLADMMGYTAFNEDGTLWDLAYNGDITLDGHNYYEDLEIYFSYSSNSSLQGVCTVNEELAELLKIVDQVVGFDDEDANEWLKFCKYYQVYGTDGVQLQDPIKGLAPFSAYEATLGKDIETNSFYYNTAIIPRGKLAKFVPTQSGVYRITSRNESMQGVEGWIFDDQRNELYCYEMCERMYNDSNNVSMLYYMEAGTPYFIDIAFWDVYEVGTIYYDIEYVAEDLELFRLASPGYFTYDTDATGEAMYHTIAGGIDVVLKDDGYYYEDLGVDENGNQIYGSMLYADFTGVTNLFSYPIANVLGVDENGDSVEVKGIIAMGGFDFQKTEGDLEILGYLQEYNNDVEATKEYLKTLWAEDYDANAEQYQIEDIFAGRYHGSGEDLTEEISGYLSKMYDGSDEERIGCVPVDARLAEILQLLMDKYTFENIDHSWTKLCYYYEYLGPDA